MRPFARSLTIWHASSSAACLAASMSTAAAANRAAASAKFINPAIIKTREGKVGDACRISTGVAQFDARPGGLRGASNFDQAYKASRADCRSAAASARLAGSVIDLRESLRFGVKLAVPPCEARRPWPSRASTRALSRLAIEASRFSHVIAGCTRRPPVPRIVPRLRRVRSERLPDWPDLGTPG